LGTIAGGSRADVVFYVSGHGFGHATRAGALLAELRARAPELGIAIRSEAPHWIFTEKAGELTCSAAPIDVGIVQRGGLDIDRPATLRAHQAFVADWAAHSEREARFLVETGAALVVADIAPVAFAAAHHAGVPAVAVTNFTWDWILEAWVDDEVAFRPIVDCYRDAYAKAARWFRLPFSGDMPAFADVTDAPLLVNHTQLPEASCRARMGLRADEARRVVLVSFGGWGNPELGADAGPSEDLAAYLFVSTEPRPSGFGGEWLDLSSRGRIPHEVLIAGCDAVIGKPGFSTAAEVIAHECRLLYLTREGFRESPVLERELAEQACASEIPRADFEAGLWRPHLDALFAKPAVTRRLDIDGARVIGDAIRSLLARR
jgi:hypothetical protein